MELNRKFKKQKQNRVSQKTFKNDQNVVRQKPGGVKKPKSRNKNTQNGTKQKTFDTISKWS